MRTILAAVALAAATFTAQADPLVGITIEPEQYADTYERKNWHHWILDDGDCQNVRAEVLITESIAPVQFKSKLGCQVKTGVWFDYYSGTVIMDASKVDVDHMVPLQEAHVSGGHKWDYATRKAFSNDMTDPLHLIVVSASENRSKAHRSPDEWLPDTQWYRCFYVINWVHVKRRWQLSMDQAEADAIRKILGAC